MNAVAPRGWCPSLFAPMASGDGLLARIKPPGCVLTAAQARAVAAAAARFGNGIVELGNRASVQTRGLTEAGMPAFTAAMLAAGLALPDPAAEARRTVVAPPLAGHDPGLSPHAATVAAALAAALAAAADLAALPGKFGCLVDGGGALPLGGVAADVVVRLEGGACHVGPDGAALAAGCAPGEAAAAVLALLRAFLALAAGCTPRPRRMRALVAAVGGEAVFAAAGLSATPLAPLRQPAQTVGWLGYGGDVGGAMLAGLPFGATDAATLTALADLAERHGDGLLRVTPFRAFALAGLADPAPLAALGLVTDPADPRARISACPGHPACAAASVATRADAAELAGLDWPGNLHVSGCVKGCAHPGAADLVLIGEAGHYAVVRHGRAGDAPARRGLTLAEAADLIRKGDIA